MISGPTSFGIFWAIRKREFAPLLGEMALAEVAKAIDFSTHPLASQLGQRVADVCVDDAVRYASASWHEARAMTPKAREALVTDELLLRRLRASRAPQKDVA